MFDSPTPDRKATALLLLVIAGFVDAVGLAETGRYFVAFMSGNTTQLGLSLAYHDYRAALFPFGLVVLFVAGCTIGALIAEKTGRRSSAVLLLVEAALLAGCCWAFGTTRFAVGPGIGVILLPIAMGLANIVTLSHGEATPAATHATGALVKLGIGLAGLGRDAKGDELLFHATIWLALLVGSVIGGVGRFRFGTEVLLAPVVMLVVLGLVELLGRRGER